MPISRACRSTASTTPATCSSARRRARPRRASRPARSRRRCSRTLRISLLSHVVQLGAATASIAHRPTPDDLAQIDASEVRCFDPDSEADMIREIKEAAKVGDSLGGVVEVLGYGVPPGLGFARALGPPHRRPARAGVDEHPGDEGGRDRRGLHGRGRARKRGARRDLLGCRRARVPARDRRTRAASKAG